MEDNEYREQMLATLERIAVALERMGPRLLTVEQVAERVAVQEQHEQANAHATLQEEYDAAKAAVDVYEQQEAKEKAQKLGVGPDEQGKRQAARERLVAAAAALKGGA